MSHATFTDRDILSGRGGKVNRHSGNRVFRRLVEAKKDLYKSLLRKEDKALLICSILQAIRSQGARFLKQDELTGKWCELDETEVFNKTSQAFREPDKKGQRSGSDDGSSSPRAGSVSPMSSIASKREFSLEECEPQLAVEDNRMPPKQEPAGSCHMQPPVVRQPAIKRLLDDDEPLPIDSGDFRSSPFPIQMAGPAQTLVSAFNKRPRPNQQQRPLTTFPTRLPQKRPGMMPPRPDQHRMEVAKYMTGLDPKNKVLAPSQASQDIFSFMKGISFGASCGPAEARNLGSSQASQDLLSIMKSGSIGGGNADLLGSLKGNDQPDSRRVPPSRQASEDFFRFMRSASIGELDFFKTEKADMLSADGTNQQQQSPSQDNKRRAPPSRQASQDFLRFMRSASIGELDFFKSEKFEMLGTANADQQQQPQDKRMAPPRQPSQDFLRFMTSASIGGGDLDFFKSEKADLLGVGMEQQDKRRVPPRHPSEELLRFMKSASIGELDFLKSENLLGADEQDKRRAPSRQPSEDFLRFMRSASVGELDFFKPETADLLSGPAGKETADGADQQQDQDKRRAPSRRTSEDFLRFMRSASIGEMENRGTEKPSQDFFLRLMQSVSSVGDINQGDADPMTILSDQEDFMKLMREGSVGPAAARNANSSSNEPLTKQDTVDLWQHCMRSLPRCDSICSTIL